MKKPKKSAVGGSVSRRDADPFGAREAERYEHPVPSRELILEVLNEAGVPMDEKDVSRQLDIGKRDREAFARRIAAMERDGQIMRNRRGDLCVVEKLDLIRGRVIGHKDGFGFLQREDDGPDLFLGPREMQKVLHGDRVMARISGMDRLIQRNDHRGARCVSISVEIDEKLLLRLPQPLADGDQLQMGRIKMRFYLQLPDNSIPAAAPERGDDLA